ncbi:MAG: glycosyltransferase family 4 protein, partial [Gammaproteobacteria bacterium]|nr:glycosyltransferase family 4 protein [Gammaproteobacteria bacterium]
PRFVTTVHGLYSVKKYSSIMTRGEKVIAVSDTIRKYILDNYLDVDEKKIQVIYRGVDPVEFPYGYNPDSDWLNKWYEQYPQLKDHHVITLPGRLTRLKGHADFIDLVSFLREKKVDVYGLIVGGDDPKRQAYAKEIRGKVKESGMQDRIIFTGLRSDMREIYAVSDIVLSLSTKPESFGRTSLEALSIGRPLVGYDQGGVGEMLHNIYPQGCVPCGDRGALQETVKNMLTQPCVVPVRHDYQLARMLSDTLRLYANLAGST